MPKILLVDDDPLIHALYKRHLEREGFEVFTAQDGVQGLAVAAQTNPDLIVMDVLMPGKDGLTTLRELRQNEATRTVPVIAITSNVSQYGTASREAALGGAARLLTKPLSAAKLLDELRRFFPPHSNG
jgi:CheY-like chemotaxis protein